MTSLFFHLLKTAAPKPPSSSHQEKLDEHFSSGDPKKWRLFRRNLRAKSFAAAVSEDERADEKLKKFSKMVNLHQSGKGPTMKVPGSSGKTHTVKYHPELGRYSCSCPDWTYVKCLRPVGSADCKHIEKVKSQTSMAKKASVALLCLGRLGLMAARKETADEQAWNAGEIARAHGRLALERKVVRSTR